MLEQLRREVCEGNLELVRQGLVLLTWGNASGIDRQRGLVVIKPSGVPYSGMKPEDMVIADLDGNVVSGRYKPSVDLATHLALYRAWPGIGGVVHTHSHYATCWAQACRPIPCFGTTHADFVHGEVPLTECLTAKEVGDNYETHTGDVIIRRYKGLDPLHFPAVLVANHGPFCWGNAVAHAVENAIVLEEIARMAMDTVALSPQQTGLEPYLLDKHFLRKHGKDAYYGQSDERQASRR